MMFGGFEQRTTPEKKITAIEGTNMPHTGV